MPPQVQNISPQSQPAQDLNTAAVTAGLMPIAERTRQENKPQASVETNLDPVSDAERLKSVLTAAVPRQQKIENTRQTIAGIASRFEQAHDAKAYLEKVSKELDKLFVISESDVRHPENLLAQLLKQWRIDSDALVNAAVKKDKKPSAADLLEEANTPTLQATARPEVNQAQVAAGQDLKSLSLADGIKLVREIWLNPDVDSASAIAQIRKTAEALGYDVGSKRFRREILKPALAREAVARALDDGWVDGEGKQRTYTRDDLLKLAGRNGPGGDYEIAFNGGKTISENNGVEAEINERLGRKSLGERIVREGARYAPGLGRFLED